MTKDNWRLNTDCSISSSRSEQNSWFQHTPHLVYLVHPSLSSCGSRDLDLESSCEGCYLLSLIQAAILQPLPAGTRQELPACSSGLENIWRTKIIAICWKKPLWKVRERPELCLKHLKHHKLCLRWVSWGGREKKYCKYGGRMCSSEHCTIPSSRATVPEGHGKYSSEQEQGSSHQ